MIEPEDESHEANTKKRKFESDDDSQQNLAKRKHFALEESLNLLDLADEILMNILCKLDGESLHNVGLTCMQLKRLSQDKKLWNDATFTSQALGFPEILKRLKHLQITTKNLRILGDCSKENIMSRPMPTKQSFKEIIKRIVVRSPVLQHLSFSHVWFDWTKEFTTSKFPANLRSISFSHCIMPKNRRLRMMRAFTGIADNIPNLEEFRYEYCNFFEPSDIMPISKLRNLKILSFRGCTKMKNCVPYLSLACRFGFQVLESIDLRETNVSDGELQCLNSIKSLKELFLEYPEIEPAQDDSDDDDDYHFYSRVLRRPTARPEANANPEPSPSPSPAPAPRDPEPSSSNASNPPPAPPAIAEAELEEEFDDSDSSSSESFSDSLPDSSSSGADESPVRTIVIRASINNLSTANNGNGQQPEPRFQVTLGEDVPHASRYVRLGRASRENRELFSVSDRGMLGFGVPRPSIGANLVFLGRPPADPNTYLERVVLRNFRGITDTTLLHFETNAPRLTYLDVRGCPQITREAVDRFKAARQQCEIFSNYDNEE